jgi:hypothetical protein
MPGNSAHDIYSLAFLGDMIALDLNVGATIGGHDVLDWSFFMPITQPKC